jgi:hypothetical protein
VSFGICLEEHLGYLEYGLMYGIFLRHILDALEYIFGTWFMAYG